MKRIYKQIEERLNIIDFATIYPGFHRFPFALYDSNKIILEDAEFPYDERFIGNTTINFNGHQIAIWNMDYPIDDLDIFTAKIVHEMFHAYQIENHESRFPDEASGLFYDYDAKNITLKINESLALIESYKKGSQHDFDKFLTIRKFRATKYLEAVGYESGIEIIEGFARFIEILSLFSLDTVKAEEEIDRMIKMISDPRNYLPIRKISYEIGALHALVKRTLKSEGKIIERFLGNLDFSYSDEVKEITDEYHRFNAEIIDQYLDKDNLKIMTGSICGFDPMNTIRSENRLYFKHFVCIEHDGLRQNIFGNSVAIIEDGMQNVRLYTSENKKNIVMG